MNADQRESENGSKRQGLRVPDLQLLVGGDRK
jgi:hypothetical protein